MADLRRLVDDTEERSGCLPLGYLGFSMGTLLGVPFLLTADRDEVFSRRSAVALYDAFLSRKELLLLPGRTPSGTSLPAPSGRP